MNNNWQEIIFVLVYINLISNLVLLGITITVMIKFGILISIIGTLTSILLFNLID